MAPNEPSEKRWEVVYNALRTAIDQGEEGFNPGDHLPTEAQIAEQYGYGRGTVRSALIRLESHGAITEANGPNGRTVKAQPKPLYWNLSRFELGARRDDPDTGVDEWAADMREQGRTPSETVEVEPFPASTEIAVYLQIPPETFVYRRRRWRYADGDLISIADTWLLDEVAKLPATSTEGKKIYPFLEKKSISLPGGLIKAVGIYQDWIEDQHYSVNASPEEAKLLGISEATAVSEIVRIGYDEDSRPFRAMITVSPGHRLSARYVLKAQHDQEES